MERDYIAEAGRLAERGKSHEQRGAFETAANDYDQAIESLAAAPPCGLLADVLRWRGTASFQMGRTSEAETWYKRSRAVADALSYTAGQAHALNCEAAVAQRTGALARAERSYLDAALLALRAGDERLQGMVEYNRGVLANIRGEFDAATAHYRMGLRVFERVGDEYQISNILNNLGMLYTDQRQFQRAEEVFQRGLVLARARGDDLVEGVLELNRAEMLCAMERWEEADAACERSLELADRRTDPLRRAEALKTRAVIERRRSSFAQAERALCEARDLACEAGDLLLVSEVLREVGRLCAGRGETAQARAAWQEALQTFIGLGARRDTSDVEAQLASLAA